ncbi:MAG: DUF547 domain-containing protein [Cyclobacteriaceae bacterium]
MFRSFVLFTIITGCTQLNPTAKGDGDQMDHSLFTKVLQRVVRVDGMVDYQQLKDNPDDLLVYLKALSSNLPSESDPVKVKMAYWINVYNAYTLKLIIDHYPVQSIKDIGATLQIPLINTPWDIELIPAGDESLTLNDVEHRILRKMEDPRIHFAINCASISCPVLRREAYTLVQLDRQLNEQAKLFLNDGKRNTISQDHLRLSPIFKWFGSDFESGKAFRQQIADWSGMEIAPNAEIDYLDYDWGLNDKIK